MAHSDKKSSGAVRTIWIALFYLLTLGFLLAGFYLPDKDGFWGMDGGMKALAAASVAEDGDITYTLPNPGEELDPSGKFLPYGFPFARFLESENRWISVYSPIYLVVGSLFWKFGGEQGMRLLSLLGTLLAAFAAYRICGQFRRKTVKVNESILNAPVVIILATPLYFYTFTVWEHTLFTGFALLSLSYSLEKKTRSAVWAGIFSAIGIMLRPEGVLWAIVLLIFQSKKLLLRFLLPLGSLIALFLVFNYLQTESILPLQWTENASLANFSIKAVFLRIQNDLGLGLGIKNIIIGLGILGFIALGNRQKDLKYSLLTMVGLLGLMVIWIVRLSKPVEWGNLAAETGWLAVVPFAALWWFFPVTDSVEKKLRLTLLAFILLVTVSNPSPPGIHYSPRLLLPAIAVATVFAYLKLPMLGKTKQNIARGFLLFSILIQLSSLLLLLEARQGNAFMRRSVERASQSEWVIISGWYMGADLGPSLHNIRALFPGNFAGWTHTLELLKADGKTQFWHLTEESSPGPDANPELGVESTGVRQVGNRWRLELYRMMEVESDSSKRESSAKALDAPG
ncbi:hypothetical protein K8I28_17120 [bacterium]|nr:hypothetical protein [bacterium]